MKRLRSASECGLLSISAQISWRWPIWVELDSNAAKPGDRLIEIHPARNFLEGHRYIVALRHLRDAQGDEIPAPAYFRALRDGTPEADQGRAAHFESLFGTLAKAGIERSSLYLAWDFTVASWQSLAGRMLHIRNDAFAQLGDRDLGDLKVQGAAPAYTLQPACVPADVPVPGVDVSCPATCRPRCSGARSRGRRSRRRPGRRCTATGCSGARTRWAPAT